MSYFILPGEIHILNSMVMEYIFLALESKTTEEQESHICSGLHKITKEKGILIA